jgi:hypothetical protein
MEAPQEKSSRVTRCFGGRPDLPNAAPLTVTLTGMYCVTPLEQGGRESSNFPQNVPEDVKVRTMSCPEQNCSYLDVAAPGRQPIK